MPYLIDVDPKTCNGCRVCELACSLYREKECNPERSRVRVVRKETDGKVFALPLVCQQCNSSPCLEACPAGAISKESERGIISIDGEECLGCGLCYQACPIGAIAVDQAKKTAFACDLCGGEPKCIDFCHANSLKYAEKVETDESRKELEGIIEAEGLKVSTPEAGERSKGEPLRGGIIIRIDLTNGKITREPTAVYSEALIGARGVDIKLLYEAVGPEVNPLDLANPIVFGAGPLTGTLAPGSSRTDVMSKSPLTGIMGESNLGGYFGPELKFAGYDHVVIQGKAKSPVYIYLHNEEVQIRDASGLWGRDCYETQEMIREELEEPRVQVVCIGPAGENLVTFASIHTCFGNTGARMGMGAIMGSKNLKALAVRGTKGLEIAEPDRFFEECRQTHKLIRGSHRYAEYHTYGTTRAQDMLARYNPGDDPENIWEDVEKVSQEAFLKEYLHKKESCFGCPVACMESYRIEGIGNGIINCGPYIDFTCGPRNMDMMLFWECYLLCQKNGLDSRTCGNLLSSLMRLYEDGIISEKRMGGIAPLWGNREAILNILQKIIRREGIGNVLADGISAAKRYFGKKSEGYFLHTKGSPYQIGISPMMKGFTLASAVSSTGDGVKGFSGIEAGAIYLPALNLDEEEAAQVMRDLETRAELVTGTHKAADPATDEGKAALVYHTENNSTIADTLGICLRITQPFSNIPLTLEIEARLLSFGLGRPVTPEELLQVSKRIRHIERSFNIREGITREDDGLPSKFLKRRPVKKRGGIFITRAGLEKMKDDYYSLRGWDIKTGAPTKAVLKDYGLEEIASDLERRGKLSPNDPLLHDNQRNH